MNAFPRRAGAPAALPISLADVLLHLKEDADSGSNDDYVLALIETARQTCEDRTERTLITTPWVLTLDGFAEALPLRQPPLVAVQSIQFIDEAGVLQTLDPVDYQVDAVSEPGYVVPAFEKTWPATRPVINAVRVSYTAGYGSDPALIPKPLRQWMLLAIGEMYTHRNRSSERPAVPHSFADALLEPYKIWG